MNMKHQDLIRTIEALGWRLLRRGGRHDVYARLGAQHLIAVARHTEINEFTARAILRQARAKGLPS
jgi:mRNA interferase HicA